MSRTVIRRALVASLPLTLLVAGLVLADPIDADGDLITPGTQGTIAAGTVAPGATVDLDVAFRLTCSGFSHVEAGSVITLSQSGTSVPADGTASASSGRITVPADWPAMDEPCPGTSQPSVVGEGISHVRLTAPTAPGSGYEFDILYGSSPSTGVDGITAVAITMTVAVPTPTPTPTPTPAPTPTPTPSTTSAAWTVRWLPPVSLGLPALPVTRGRTVPVAFALLADGISAGADPTPGLHLGRLATCAPGAVAIEELQAGGLRWLDGRWMALVDTSSLAAGCWRVEVRAGSATAGAAILEVVAGSRGR